MLKRKLKIPESLLNHVPSVPTCQNACVPAWYMCQRACVPTCQKHANFSCLRANVPYGVPMFQLGLPTCLKACQFFKRFFSRNTKWKFLYFFIIKKFYIILNIIGIHNKMYMIYRT